MTLTDLLAHYVAHHDYGVSATYHHQLRISVSAIERHAGRSLQTSDLCDELLNSYVDWLRAERKPDTVRTRRGNLLILWRYAWREGIVEQPPRKIRRLRPIQRSPVAWTREEVLQLISTATEQVGTFWNTTTRRAAWWESLIRAAYDTALRLGDLRRISRDDVRERMLIVQSKTGRPVHVAIRPATVAAIDQTLADSPRELVWQFWASDETFYCHFRQLVKEAGIRPGTMRWLRRTAATQVEMVSPGAGTILLGHSARATTEQWYLDLGQILSPILPPL